MFQMHEANVSDNANMSNVDKYIIIENEDKFENSVSFLGICFQSDSD